jgi:hypothetical protein
MLSSANSQAEKVKGKESSSEQTTRSKIRSVKDKTKPTKDSRPTSTSYCRHKGHIADNDSLDADTKSLDPNLPESDEDEVEEVVAHS